MVLRRTPYGAILTLLSLGLWMVYHYNPETTAWFPKCLLYQATGLHCPGCGTARAIFALLHGDIIASLRNQILLLPSIVLCTVLIIKPSLNFNKHLCWSVLIVVCAYAILRNLPWKPFVFLAPILN